jgi:plasmid stabilization system protein ParE
MRVAWTVEAAAELNSMLAYISAQDPAAAALVVERVLQAEASIETFPKAGSYDAKADTYDRYVPKTRIVLSYAIRDDVIWIVTAWHTSRDPATKPKRSI